MFGHRFSSVIRHCVFVTAVVVVAACSDVAGPAASVEVLPNPAAVAVGSTVQLSAVVRNADGIPLPDPEVTWESSDGSVATVDASGLVSGIAEGAATVTATSEGQSGATTVMVVLSLAPVASVEVTPNPTSVAVGRTVQLTATPKDAAGNPLTGRVVLWSSSNSGVAAVDPTGIVGGVAEGTATITAASEGRSGSASVTVTAQSAAYPNEPVGAISRTGARGWPFDWSNVVAKNPPETAAQPWEGIYFQGNWGGVPCNECRVNPAKASTVTNQNGPVNATTVGRYIYNSANAPSPFGDALIKPSSLNRFVVPTNVVKQYVSMWVKFSPNWFFPAGGMKLANIWTDAVSRAIILECIASGAARPGYESVGYTEPPYYLKVRIAYDGKDGLISQIGGHDESYFDNNPRMYNDVWYHVEFLVDWNTHFVELFLDGVKVADGTSSVWPTAGQTEFSVDGTLGGQCTGCPQLPATMYWYQDDLYMSYTLR